MHVKEYYESWGKFTCNILDYKYSKSRDDRIDIRYTHTDKHIFNVDLLEFNCFLFISNSIVCPFADMYIFYCKIKIIMAQI